MRRNNVRLDWKNAALSTAFGLEWAIKLFGEEAIGSLPVLKSGKNKGQPKGFVHWRKALSGGWCDECQSPVAVGQLVDAWIGLGFASNRSDALAGQWLGRIQPLAGSRYHLFQEGRDRHAAEQAKLAAVWEEEKAEMLAEKGI